VTSESEYIINERRQSVDMKFCDERHSHIDNWHKDIKDDIKSLFSRLNWFYLIAISTLAVAIANFFKG
jgi:hypothetical protein